MNLCLKNKAISQMSLKIYFFPFRLIPSSIERPFVLSPPPPPPCSGISASEMDGLPALIGRPLITIDKKKPF